MTTLMYHDIFSESPAESGFTTESAMPYKVGRSTFIAGIEALKTRHPDLGAQIEFTFDDGGVSAMDAATILEKNGLRGIFFISTAFIDKTGFLSAEQIRELSKRGHIIGAHSHSHTYDKKAIALEWKESVKILSDIIEAPISIASSPHGLVSRDIIKQAANCGISTLYTTEPTTKPHTRYGVEIKGRFCIHYNDSPANVISIASSCSKQLVLHTKWRVLSFLRIILGSNYPQVKSRYYNLIYAHISRHGKS